MLHANILPINNHTIAAWVVADAAAFAAIAPVAGDEGKVAIQQSPIGVYCLVNATGPVWQALALPATALSDITGLLADMATAQADIVTNATAISAHTASITTLITRSKQVISIAASDEATALVAGTGITSFRAPYNFNVIEVIAELSTAQASGSIFTADVNLAGSSILSTKLTIDNTEYSTLTAATAPVLSISTITKGDKISFDIDQVGASGAKGLKFHLVGYPL